MKALTSYHQVKRAMPIENLRNRGERRVIIGKESSTIYKGCLPIAQQKKGGPHGMASVHSS